MNKTFSDMGLKASSNVMMCCHGSLLHIDVQATVVD